MPSANLSHIVIGLTLLAAYIAPMAALDSGRRSAPIPSSHDAGQVAGPAFPALRLGAVIVETKAPLDLAQLPASAFGDWDSAAR